jgi:hypothetical protein
MSFLAPLYALGLLAIVGPIIFHLIRRRPKGEVPFSSLLFLTASPPPPARRRRLDQVLLLLLRAAVLALLGIAFMRPFLRTESAADTGGPGQTVVVLIDTSASMKRADLWKRAQAEADAALAECRPADRIAVYAFDRTVRPVLGLAESDTLDPSVRTAVARTRVAGLSPTWGGTELGQALLDGVAAILESDSKGRASGKVVLVSDLQQGAKLTGLAGFEWPAEIGLELRTVTDPRGNAGIDWLVDRGEEDPKGEAGQLRVRLTNDTDSGQEKFRLAWDKATGGDVEAYVPPGESRVVKVPRPPNDPNPTLRLNGDAHEFDNTLYLAPRPREELSVVFLGPDTAEPDGLRYYLERTWGETPDRVVRIATRLPDDFRSVPLVVLHGEPPADAARSLGRYLKDGGTVLAVLSAGPAGTLANLAGVPAWTVEEAQVARYAMLRDIAFDHPLFAPLAGPQFGDFTKVSFWKHRRVTEQQLGGARVLARFDDGDAAVLEKTVGRGRLVVFAAGWQPADSQLARTSKFVPLMTALLELRSGRRSVALHYRVGDRIPLGTSNPATGVRKPDGTTIAIPTEAASFDGTDAPGVYVLDTSAGPRPFAVNLDPAESATTPIPVEALEGLGVRMVQRDAEARRREAERQQQTAELERSQSIWRGLMVAAIAILLLETLLAGWRSRPSPTEGGTP